MNIFKAGMNTFLLKSLFTITVAVGVVFGGQLASAGNLPSWGGATTTTQPQPIQPPRQPLVSEPAPITAQTIQPTPPSSWTAPGNTSSPTGSTPTQQQPTYQPKPVYQPNTQFQTAPTPLRLQNPTGGSALRVSPPAQSPAAGDTQEAAPQKKARFRVTINGFRIFAVKGIMPRRGHTYYAAAKVMRYTQGGSYQSHNIKSTKLIGHTNKFPGALKGGTATKNGGFRNGDVYPGSIPYFATGVYNDRLPLLVWEGELEEGGDIVVIEPALWEKRNGESILRAWQQNAPQNIGNLYPCFPRHWDLTQEFYGVPIPTQTAQNPAPIDELISGPIPPWNAPTGLEDLQESSRICVEITPPALFRPTGRDEPDVIAGLTEKTFYVNTDNSYERGKVDVSFPYGMLLNYSVAEKMANESRTEPVYAVEYWSNSFPSGFIRKNKRMETYLPEGGIQVSMFSRIPSDRKTMKISGANSAFVIPDWTVIELYVQVRRL